MTLPSRSGAYRPYLVREALAGCGFRRAAQEAVSNGAADTANITGKSWTSLGRPLWIAVTGRTACAATSLCRWLGQTEMLDFAQLEGDAETSRNVAAARCTAPLPGPLSIGPTDCAVFERSRSTANLRSMLGAMVALTAARTLLTRTKAEIAFLLRQLAVLKRSAPARPRRWCANIEAVGRPAPANVTHPRPSPQRPHHPGSRAILRVRQPVPAVDQNP
jgi:hypothetical protein